MVNENSGTFPKRKSSEPILIARPFVKFIRSEAISGIFLILSVLIALIWVNLISFQNYSDIWGTTFSIKFGSFELSKSILLWTNEFLMAIFFLLIGLEIKRELLIGELSTLKKASLPAFAAIGGMVVPVFFYVIFNPPGSVGERGWAIAMSTDIAFSLGVLYMLGTRVPTALRVFLASLAIVDDIFAVLVIAFFYSASIKTNYLIFAAIVLAILILANKLGIRRLSFYIVAGLFLWYFVFKSGVHSTIAGVLLAFTIPATTNIDYNDFKNISRELVDRLDKTVENEEGLEGRRIKIYQSTIRTLEKSCEDVEAPLQRFEHNIAPFVTFGIMPIFALVNGGVLLNQFSFNPIIIGVIMGLVIGKPLGIFLFTYVAIKLGLTELPKQLNYLHILGAGMLAGIGFTMSIFVAGLAFPTSIFAAGERLALTKIGILIASTISAIAGILTLLYSSNRSTKQESDHS